MKIISEAESRQILKNDLIRQAREKFAAQLESADAEERQRIMGQIERDAEEELRRRDPKRKRTFLSRMFSGGEDLLH